MKIFEYGQEIFTMERYMSKGLISFYENDLNIIADSFFYKEAKQKMVVLPKNDSIDFCDKIIISIYKDEKKVAVIEKELFNMIDIVLDQEVQGKLKIEASTIDGKLAGTEYIFIGDIEKEIQMLSERLSGISCIDVQIKNDLECYIKDIYDIYTLQETTIYEPRMMFAEEIRALIDGLDYLSKVLKILEQGLPYNHESRRGLILNSYYSRLDNKIQYYYTYMPENYNKEKQYSLLIILKYLYKRVQIPGFIYNPKLKNDINRDVIILCPIGRGINRYEVAGEIDLMEALEDLQKRYNIDKDKVFLCGFSMGGGACWNFAQKYPSVFKGIITSSSNLNEKFNCNLVNTKIIYINGELDTMFDSIGNYQKMELFKKNVPKDYVENILLKKTGHFELYTIYNDKRTFDWVRKNHTSIVPKRVHFKTDSLRYCNSYWITIDDIIDPSLDSEIEANVRGSNINIKTANIKKLRLHQAVISEYGINKVVLNGGKLKIHYSNEPEIIIDKVQSNAPVVLCNNRVRYGEYRSKNVCGLGLIEVYYDRLAVIAYPGNNSKVNAIVKKLAGSFSRPIYYGEYRERYAEIPVFSGDEDISIEFLNGNLILIGDENQGIVKKVTKELKTSKKIETLKSKSGSEVFGLFLKVPSVFNRDKRIVLQLIYKAEELERYKNTDIFKGKFSYPFSTTRDLMRNDAVIFTDNGIYSYYMDAAWNILELSKYKCL